MLRLMIPLMVTMFIVGAAYSALPADLEVPEFITQQTPHTVPAPKKTRFAERHPKIAKAAYQGRRICRWLGPPLDVAAKTSQILYFVLGR